MRLPRLLPPCLQDKPQNAARAVALIRRTARGVSSPQARHKAACFIEPMDARIGAPALQQDLVAVALPRFRKCCANHRATVAPSLMVGMRHHVFDDGVLATTSQQVWNGNEHAG